MILDHRVVLAGLGPLLAGSAVQGLRAALLPLSREPRPCEIRLPPEKRRGHEYCPAESLELAHSASKFVYITLLRPPRKAPYAKPSLGRRKDAVEPELFVVNLPRKVPQIR